MSGGADPEIAACPESAWPVFEVGRGAFFILYIYQNMTRTFYVTRPAISVAPGFFFVFGDVTQEQRRTAIRTSISYAERNAIAASKCSTLAMQHRMMIRHMIRHLGEPRRKRPETENASRLRKEHRASPLRRRNATGLHVIHRSTKPGRYLRTFRSYRSYQTHRTGRSCMSPNRFRRRDTDRHTCTGCMCLLLQSPGNTDIRCRIRSCNRPYRRNNLCCIDCPAPSPASYHRWRW